MGPFFNHLLVKQATVQIRNQLLSHGDPLDVLVDLLFVTIEVTRKTAVVMGGMLGLGSL